MNKNWREDYENDSRGCLTFEEFLEGKLNAIVSAGNLLLSAMDMQEGRETERLHIPQETALSIWNDAKVAWRKQTGTRLL